MDVFVSICPTLFYKEIQSAIRAEQPEYLARINQTAQKGIEIWKSFALRSGGSVIFSEGEKLIVQIPALNLDELPALQLQYSNLLKSPVAIGVATSLEKANTALEFSKNLNSNRISFYSDEMVEKIKASKEKKDNFLDFFLEKVETPTKDRPKASVTENPVLPSHDIISDTSSDYEMPAPEVTHAAKDFLDMKEQLHGLAQEQSTKDQQAVQQNSSQLIEIKQQVAQLLQQIKEQTPEITQLQQQAPDIYQSFMGMAQAVVALARQLPETPQPPQSSEVQPTVQKEEISPSKEPNLDKEEISTHTQLNLPVGSLVNGKIKARTPTGSSWRSVRSGLVSSKSGNPASARRPDVK